MIKSTIEKLIAKENLSLEDSYEFMNRIMNGEVNNSHIASFLTALKAKGETAEEVAGFAKSMRSKSIKVNSEDPDTIDVCGTGGDNSGTFNISTAAAFVVAGAGVRVAKHGNRSISSLSGSADVLQNLGVNINYSQSKAEYALNKIGISFLFAPVYHPAMKFAAPVRKELGMKTVFNILGPLTNPANTKKQLIGVFNSKTAQIMRDSVKYLGMDKVVFVCTDNKFDEITLHTDTEIFEYNTNKTNESYKISAKAFGLNQLNFTDIKGDSSEYNAKLILEILKDKKKGAPYYVTVANAAMGLYAAGKSKEIRMCTELAEKSILSGEAYSKLVQLAELGN